MTDSTVNNNTAKNGGGIYNDGTMTLTDSNVNNNTASQMVMVVESTMIL